MLLFSGGKDSVVMLRLAEKAFWPAQLPFPVMHVDTGHNFPEVIEFRDRTRRASWACGSWWRRCRTSSTPAAWSRRPGPRASRNRLQTVTLLDAIEEHRFDAVFGGARRDEEKARAKERVFSFRDEFGQWDPKNQRPELWSLYNGRHRRASTSGCSRSRTGPSSTSGSTSREEDIELPSIYYAHRREVFRRDGMLLAVDPYVDAARRRGAVRGHSSASAPSAT